MIREKFRNIWNNIYKDYNKITCDISVFDSYISVKYPDSVKQLDWLLWPDGEITKVRSRLEKTNLFFINRGWHGTSSGKKKSGNKFISMLPDQVQEYRHYIGFAYIL